MFYFACCFLFISQFFCFSLPLLAFPVFINCFFFFFPSSALAISLYTSASEQCNASGLQCSLCRRRLLSACWRCLGCRLALWPVALDCLFSSQHVDSLLCFCSLFLFLSFSPFCVLLPPVYLVSHYRFLLLLCLQIPLTLLSPLFLAFSSPPPHSVTIIFSPSSSFSSSFSSSSPSLLPPRTSPQRQILLPQPLCGVWGGDAGWWPCVFFHCSLVLSLS